MNYYVFTNKYIKDNLTLDQAAEEYRLLSNAVGYKALGVNRTSWSACDLITNKGEGGTDIICPDYLKLERFRDNPAILEIVELLRDAFVKK